ncbi:MAG: prepilin-type N-terminal cleavage/methylation domain-containing protein [Phycisphaerales bacterium]|nr:prepilin-type N-terminal cleavage/methylation domain-containing protein [Phycisphaerales bacterium]
MSIKDHHRPSPPAWRTRAFVSSGFTLVELVVVLAIIALGSSIALFRFSSSATRYRLELAAARLKQDLELIQMRAMSSGAARTIRFDRPGSTYVLVGEPGLKARSADYTIALAEEPYRVTMSSVVVGDGRSVLVFDGWGQPTEDLSVTLNAGELRRVITVDRSGGTVVVATP